MGGFSIVPLAQKARTKTLIADSDLNLGNYDLIATDVKGDTAEFTEFVGGVGNFSNVLGSGNLDIEGTASIKGNTQIDGNIVLEGAINNVNITSDGNINSVGTITSTGVINANGGVKGNLTGNVTGDVTGNVTGRLYTPATVSTTKGTPGIAYVNNPVVQSTSLSSSNTSEVTSNTITVNGLTKKSISYPYKVSPGIYIKNDPNFTLPSINRTLTLTMSYDGGTLYDGPHYMKLYVNNNLVKTFSLDKVTGSQSDTYTVKTGDSVYFVAKNRRGGGYSLTFSMSIAAGNANYYLNG